MAKYKINLSVKEIDGLIAELEKYQSSLTMKCEMLVEKLADRGISIGKIQAGQYGNMLVFRKDFTASTDFGCTCIIVMGDLAPIHKMWDYFGTIKTEDISPSLMAEFGSGKYALNNMQGTFPRSDGKPSKGNNPPWHWKDLQGEWHSSSGTRPTRPLFHAMEEIRNTVEEVAKEVFGNE